MAPRHEEQKQGNMSKNHGGEMEGPILTPMTEMFGNPKEFESTGGGVYNGMPGYPKGTPTTAEELTFDDSGAFGKIPKAKE